jgi:RimJ/RimL family protein N-acetyltransferase
MLVGTKISIGPFVPDDCVAMYCWANDIAAARLNGAFRPVNLVDVVREFEVVGKDPSRVSFAIRLRTSTTIIGYVHIHNISGVHRSADIGIRIGEEKNRGQGYGKEALMLALDYCWRHLNLNRVGLIVFRNNPRAVSVYKAAGFRTEGCFRKLFFIDGAWVDVLAMAAFRPTRKRARAVALDRISGADASLAPAQSSAPQLTAAA